MLPTSAQAAVPAAYSAMVTNSARLRPMRSAIQPNSTPPAAQPSSRTAVIVLVE